MNLVSRRMPQRKPMRLAWGGKSMARWLPARRRAHPSRRKLRGLARQSRNRSASSRNAARHPRWGSRWQACSSRSGRWPSLRRPQRLRRRRRPTSLRRRPRPRRSLCRRLWRPRRLHCCRVRGLSPRRCCPSRLPSSQIRRRRRARLLAPPRRTRGLTPGSRQWTRRRTLARCLGLWPRRAHRHGRRPAPRRDPWRNDGRQPRPRRLPQWPLPRLPRSHGSHPRGPPPLRPWRLLYASRS
mmetsp:Transcript_107368/g.302134  ORF Transcript_107368/g.302134 Transcript_107368/m.302134 type:complete len:240 (-) Transcript_107368:475-1194(-)